MPFGSSKECTCLECGSIFPHAKKLSEHFKKSHKVSPVDYCIKHMYAGEMPTCIECGAPTRFVSFVDGFKRYCKEHRSVAEAMGGRVGGSAKKQRSQRAATKNVNERFAELRSAKQPATIVNKVPDVVIVPFPHIVPPTRDHASSVLEVSDFVKSLGFTDVHVSTRKVISPLELDVWVPEKNVAIEYHGLYWHSGGKSDVFDKGRHRQKYDACDAAGIRLMQFFSDEWTNRGDICRSMISNALGANVTKLNARDCDVVELSSAQSRTFVDANHISGATRAKHHIGLVHPQHGLVSVVTTRTPIQKKHGNLCELARMCSLGGTNVRGGASKLLARVDELARKDGFDGVLSYADLRFGKGGVYEECGFELVGDSGLSYGYTDGHQRFNRFKFRAQKPKTEKEIADENGVRPVWYSGNRIYVKRFT